MCMFSALLRPAFDLDPVHLLYKLRNHVSSLTALQPGTSRAHWTDYPSLLACAAPLRTTSIAGALGVASTAPMSQSCLEPAGHMGRQCWLRSIHIWKSQGWAGDGSHQHTAAKLTQAGPRQLLLLSSCFGTCDSDLEQTLQI